MTSTTPAPSAVPTIHSDLGPNVEAAIRLRAKACTLLGGRYRDGFTVERDEGRAAELFREACEKKDAEGCGSLGLMEHRGEGVAQDLGGAALLFERACDSG